MLMGIPALAVVRSMHEGADLRRRTCEALYYLASAHRLSYLGSLSRGDIICDCLDISVHIA
jgi:hypothetical protein